MHDSDAPAIAGCLELRSVGTSQVVRTAAQSSLLELAAVVTRHLSWRSNDRDDLVQNVRCTRGFFGWERKEHGEFGEVIAGVEDVAELDAASGAAGISALHIRQIDLLDNQLVNMTGEFKLPRVAQTRRKRG